MTLKRIVAVLGGDLYAGGRRANVPAPGHSPDDRSVSLLLSEDRVLIHSFGEADWRDARDELLRLGLVDRAGRITGHTTDSQAFPGRNPAPGSAPKADLGVRRGTAARLWDDALPLTDAQSSGRYLDRRGVAHGLSASDLRHHPVAPVSVYRNAGPARTALVARIAAPDATLTAVELTYLEPHGGLACALNLPRKTVGVVPPGSAVRLAEAAETLLVAEGVITTLSAMAWFGLPGWALMAVRNLAVWSPPAGVRRVVIAGDRGAPGEAAAERLEKRLRGWDVKAEIQLPEPGFADWNEAILARVSTGGETARAKGGGRAERGAGTAEIGSAGRRESSHDRYRSRHPSHRPA